MNTPKTMTVDGKKVEIGGAHNLLEVINMTGVSRAAFAKHAPVNPCRDCKECMVEVEGVGVMPSCLAEPREGMVVHTDIPASRQYAVSMR